MRIRYATFLLAMFIFAGMMSAQTSLLHNTGLLKVEIRNNGVIGADHTGAGGGVVFGSSPNAMFTAGFVMTSAATGVTGQVGSFTSGNLPVITDLTNTSQLVGFTSTPLFNQNTVAGMSNGGFPNVAITQRTMSQTNDKFVFFRYELKNNGASAVTDLYVGIFADWDVGLNNYTLNRGGYDATRHMVYQFEQGGAADPNYYGIVAMNGMAGGMIDTGPASWTTTDLRTLLHAMFTSTAYTPISVNGDYRSYISSGPYSIQAGQTIAVHFAFVAGSTLADLQANATAAQAKLPTLPVELTSFTATTIGNNVVLNWETASEINNSGFEVQRQSATGEFTTVGFVKGVGTTMEKQTYSYTDKGLLAGSYSYRLRQVDFDGTAEFSRAIQVNVTNPLEFALDQNFPNPFNPSTSIRFSLPEAGYVKLTVYNSLGESVAQLVNGTIDAGLHEVSFSAANLTSGLYFYTLEANNTKITRKMTLLK